MLSLDRSKNDTSVTLDLLRAIAAQMVCVGHALNFFMGNWPSSLPYMQNVGVLLFFILSGFLIMHTLIKRSERSDYGFTQFLIDRFARIYSGLIPALVLIIAIDWIVIHLTADPHVVRYFNLKTLVANLFMLESYRGAFENNLRWSAFGSASPLWTLAIEWHIYMFVGAVFFMLKAPRSFLHMLPIALFFGQTSLHFLSGSYQPDGVGRGLFSLWLGGAALYFVTRNSSIPRWPAIAMAISGLAIFVATHPAHAEYNLAGYPLLLIAVIGVIAATQTSHLSKGFRMTRAISFFADYSFTLYLIHHTLMYAMWVIWPDRGVLMFGLAVTISNLFAIGLAAIGEKHHHRVALFLSNRRPL
ncbi:acyltransferase family protein [Bradyrhizobium roseum]|uniref:acyltransferase family protein n=1 Tax=Bradyrhizobium roseum TaxID=3056648 RepID=UPI00260D5216|nr:acyltransferase [Bradyrhizobium roseus]WKA30778.1 acyltransferase [Bradyrhizobium roseus]